MRVNFRGTKLSRIADFQIFAVFIFADAGVTNIILLVCTSISILIKDNEAEWIFLLLASKLANQVQFCSCYEV